MEAWVPGFVTGSLALIAAVSSGFITSAMQSRRERRAQTFASGAPGAPTVQQVWERQDRMERAFKSALVLLGEVAEQTEDRTPPLVLSRKHVNILASGNYLPKEWDFMVDDRGEDSTWPTEQVRK